MYLSHQPTFFSYLFSSGFQKTTNHFILLPYNHPAFIVNVAKHYPKENFSAWILLEISSPCNKVGYSNIQSDKLKFPWRILILHDSEETCYHYIDIY